METLSERSHSGPIVDGFLLGVESRIPLRISTSEIITAGWGIVAERQIQSNEEFFYRRWWHDPSLIRLVICMLTLSAFEEAMTIWAIPATAAFDGLAGHFLGKQVPQTNSTCPCAALAKSCDIAQRFDSLQSDGIGHITRATIRLVHLRLSGELTEDQWSALLTLKSHKDKLKVSDGSFWFNVNRHCQYIKVWTNTDVEQDILEDIMCIFVINSMSIGSPEGTVIGSCLAPFAALMNHSCDPNSAVFFEGPELRVRSTRKIEKGEEITISYTNPIESFEFRQKQLSKYYFVCKCKKCEAKAPGEGETGDAVLNGPTNESQQLLRALLQSKPNTISPEAVEASATRICHEGYPGKRWPCDIPPMPSLQLTLAQLYHEKQNWPKAYGLWLKICFETDPIVWVSQYSLHRVENFMRYVGVEGHVANLLPVGDPSVQKLQLLKSAISAVQYPHVKRFVQDARIAFGRDSTMAKVAGIWEQRWDNILDDQGADHRMFETYWASDKGRLELKGYELKLLEWAQNFVI